MFNALSGHETIIMATNTRMTHVCRGIFQAARDMDAAVIMELAKSESNLEGGYTGLTPAEYSKRTREAADEVGFDAWALHADHITITKGTPEEIEDVKKLIKAQIKAGYTSYAIDASHLFNFEGKDLRQELAQNIDVTTELAGFIQAEMGDKEYGLEVEVGEIGRKGEEGMVLTRPEEAVTFIKALNENGVQPHVLAIANGSTHGNIYDENGNLIAQVSIDIPRTRAVAQALRDNNLNVHIAQHGITGTPREFINTQFPKGDIIKGNVGTFWMNLVWEVFKVYEPGLYKDIWDWTVDTYGPKMPGKKDTEVFGKSSKMAIKEFFKDIYSIHDDTVQAIEAMAYAEALTFFKAFSAGGTASIVRDYSP
jgi:fructose-bisphosphate aldolase class II